MNHRRSPSSFFPLPIIFVLQVMLGIPHSLGSPELYEGCRDAQFKCGNISAGYPFSGDGIPPFCGHPDLQLDCENDTPIIEIVNVRYQVLDIHPDRQTLWIARLDFIKNDLCNPEFPNSTLDYEPFDFAYTLDYAKVTLLYNCSNLTQTPLGHLNCNVNRAAGYNVWVLSEVVESVSCSARVTVPILRSSWKAILDYSSLRGGLQEGFEVKWKEDRHLCQMCNETGGECRFNWVNETICYCPNANEKWDEKTGCTRLPPASPPPYGGTQPKGIVPTTLCTNDPRHSDCRTTIRCGSIANIDYPFWGMNRANYCGQPGFELKCEDDLTKITMSQNILRILDINPLQQILKVAREDYWHGYCPMELINTTINFNHYHYGTSLRNLTLFYGACGGSVTVPVYETAAQNLEVNPRKYHFMGNPQPTSSLGEQWFQAKQSVVANDGNISSCSTLFSYGNVQNIGYPFWGLDRPESCGYLGFKLNCNEDIPEITIMSATYRVLNINSPARVLEVARIDYIDNICPTYLANFTFNSSLFKYNMNTQIISLYYGCEPLTVVDNLTSTEARWISSQFECTINRTDIIGYYATMNITETFFGSLATSISNSLGYCKNSVIIPVLSSEIQSLEENRNSDALVKALRVGFELQSSANDSFCNSCLNSHGQCGHNLTSGEFICYCSDGSYSNDCTRSPPVLTVAAAIVIVVLFTICFIVLRFKGEPLSNRNPIHLWQRKMNNNAGVEAFITKFGSRAPKRYSYVDIKKMTNKFKDKLGQGGYGSVYKGKLPDGCLVAVKVLSESKGKGEDFMNEVASITRTSHVNIVTLLGFCYDGSKKALIYEFMPLGSLDTFIRNQGSQDQSRQLEWKTLYDIALGTARGLEYLHQGCNTRILHFDIKPHNILLDENFCPKISDFGLSKLCERKESIISMTGARGTAGYIAPEVFCRNFGGVSHKSDVYSYGMMVLKMVEERKIIDVEVSQSSEIYFPSSIYMHIDQALNLSLLGVTTEEEEEITRKLIVVSLWCIQTNPSGRPSMTKVLEMLQGNLQSLVIPPRPFVSSPVRSPKTSSEISSLMQG
ncbi:hypothetical protein CRYUN_Cryun23aG0015400 [Craigia yunnanensis]